jgi:hypothetical protein
MTKLATNDRPRVMVYKRTHTGDPTPDGLFGLSDCMGRVRAREFDAVIGVGGLSAEPRFHGIDGRVTWVGVGARRCGSIPVGHRGPIIEFNRFRLFEQRGPRLDSIAPALARHLFAVHRRVIMSDGLNELIQSEIAEILALAALPARKGRGKFTRQPKCIPTRMNPRICPPRKRVRTC